MMVLPAAHWRRRERWSAGQPMEMNSGNEAPGVRDLLRPEMFDWLAEWEKALEGRSASRQVPLVFVHCFAHSTWVAQWEEPSIVFCRAAGGWRLINGRRRQIRGAQRHRQRTGSSACA